MPVSRREFGQTLAAAAVSMSLESAGVEAQTKSAGAELYYASAVELAARLRGKDVSAREVMTAHLAQIERVNPHVNAIVTLVAERAMADAARADEAIARGGPIGVLHGLPVAHKDLVDTAGIRTTRGSPFYRDHVPDRRRADRHADSRGGRDHHRQDQHAGVRRRIADLQHGLRRDAQSVRSDRRPAAAAAAAPRWRSPAAWCRSPTAATPAARCATPPRSATSSGSGRRRARVPRFQRPGRRSSVSGPMARTVADVALFLSAIAGPDPRNPLSHRRGRRALSRAARAQLQGRPRRVVARPRRHPVRARDPRRGDRRAAVRSSRISDAWSRRPSPTSPASTRRSRRCATRRNHAQYAPLVRERPDWVKDTIRFEVAQAERADRRRRRPGAWPGRRSMFDQTRAVLRALRLLRPAGHAGGALRRRRRRIPTRIDDTPMATYIDWMRSCWYITIMANPAISVPAGFTAGGLPVGLQIVGRHRDDWSVLQIAHAFEQATRHGQRRPAL